MAEKLKYLGVAFKSDERQDEKLNVRSGKASAETPTLHHSVVLKRGLSRKAKLSKFKSIFSTILTYGHEPWVMTERVLSQMQASENDIFPKNQRVTMFDKHRNTAIQKYLNIESLLLCIETSQLRWFGHVGRMPQERLPQQTLYAEVNGKRSVGRP